MNRLIQYMTQPRRRLVERALRRIVEAHALALWANDSADQETYQRLANDRDDAIEAAIGLVRAEIKELKAS